VRTSLLARAGAVQGGSEEVLPRRPLSSKSGGGSTVDGRGVCGTVESTMWDGERAECIAMVSRSPRRGFSPNMMIVRVPGAGWSEGGVGGR